MPHLVDLPPELRALIISRLDALADVGALAIAAPAFLVDPLAVEVDRRLCALGVLRLLASGAPVDVVAYVFERRGVMPRFDMVPAAVSGGRLDLLRWLSAKAEKLPGWASYTLKARGTAVFAVDRVDSRDECESDDSTKCENRSDDSLKYESDSDNSSDPYGPTSTASGDWDDSECTKDGDQSDDDGAVYKGGDKGDSGYRKHPNSCERDDREQAKGAKRSKVVWGDYIVDSVMPAQDAGRAALSALEIAIKLDRTDLLRCLLVEHPVVPGAAAVRSIFKRLLIHAATHGSLGALAHLHGHAICEGGPFACADDILVAAIDASQIAVIEWLVRVRCLSTSDSARGVLGKIVRAGSLDVLDWALNALDFDAEDGCISSDDMVTAVEIGRAHAVARVCASGLGTLSPALIAAAFRQGRSARTLIEWMVSSASSRSVSDPINRDIGYAAVRYAPRPMMKWLLTLPGIGRVLTIGTVRMALARRDPDRAIAMHDSGIVCFDGWDALVVACVRGLPCLAAAVAKRSTIFSRRAIQAAIAAGLVDALDIMRPHYTTDRVQEAIDALAGLCCHPDGISWLVCNFATVCTADVRAGMHRAVDRYCDICRVQGGDDVGACPCPRCIVSVAG
ncbi:hypothetical protein psal_cds_982 [Pandoravirus salinus]|uniref:Ankyrin repeat domain containing protein n=1 Tax=Pandoravirus salinus TaxID=1349410 RepID=S4VXQ1_9VIRU|nr:hypothetical protein psal_cds_982 [Pandoravirus salinus]AGO85143.2 hypothetical protein psal_cds_982 [Pandoravirus salinus]